MYTYHYFNILIRTGCLCFSYKDIANIHDSLGLCLANCYYRQIVSIFAKTNDIDEVLEKNMEIQILPARSHYVERRNNHVSNIQTLYTTEI